MSPEEYTVSTTRYCTATTHDWVRLTPDFQYCRECGETVVAQDAATATLRAVSQAAREALS